LTWKQSLQKSSLWWDWDNVDWPNEAADYVPNIVIQGDSGVGIFSLY
jgi:hypothetical protein